MKITLVISCIASGGAERVLVSLAQGFLQDGHEVSLVALGKPPGGREFYEIPPQVKRWQLELLGVSRTLLAAIYNNFRRLRSLRYAIRQTVPNVVISFMDHTNILCILALWGTGLPVIVTEHFDPTARSCGKAWQWLRRLTYIYATRLVTPSPGAMEYFSWLSAAKKMVIYNPLGVLPQDTEYPIPEGVDATKNWLVAMGRLTYAKGFDLLLQAFHKIAPHHPDWQLIILGTGELLSELENLREHLGLEKSVVFLGFVQNPFPLLKQAKLFVMSSRFEAFPNALVEAMACGLPAISFNCRSGPNEIIRDGIDGILVAPENVEALAQALDRLMSDKEERKRLASRATQVKERFGLEKIIGIWEKLLTNFS
jgi:glycosyltransferase involved in cell wall biosynthesis